MKKLVDVQKTNLLLKERNKGLIIILNCLHLLNNENDGKKGVIDSKINRR